MRQWAIRSFGLSKQYGRGAAALRGVDLAILPGEVCALAGAPGAGKSTLLRVLATATRADHGSFYLAGHRVTTWPGHRPPLRAVRRCVGFLPEEPGHYLDLTGWESGLLYGRAYGLAPGDARQRLGILLDWAGLAPLAARPVAAYAYPERRRLALVQALLHRPPVLLLDHPGRGQPPAFRQELAALLRGLAAGGTAALVAVDDLPTGLAGGAPPPELAGCSRTLRLEGGRLQC